MHCFHGCTRKYVHILHSRAASVALVLLIALAAVHIVVVVVGVGGGDVAAAGRKNRRMSRQQTAKVTSHRTLLPDWLQRTNGECGFGCNYVAMIVACVVLLVHQDLADFQ